MDNLKLTLGTIECPIQTVASIIGEAEKIIDNWSSLARGLGISYAEIKRLRQNIILQNNITYSDLIYDILEKWVGLQGEDAKLIKIILVIEEECEAVDVGESIRFRFNVPKSVHDTLSWENLTKTLQNKVVKTVHKLIPCLKFEDIKPLLNGVALYQLLKGIPEIVPEVLPYYIPRKVVTRNIISLDILETFSSHVFLILGIEPYELSKLAKENVTDSSSHQLAQGKLTVKYIKLDSRNHFQKICQLTTRPVHMFCYEGDKLRWLQSRGGISAVQECVKRSQDVINEEDFIASLNSDSNQPVCIVDSPGMGKSILLAQIGRKLIQIDPDRTVLFLPLTQLVQEVSKIDIVEILHQIFSHSTSSDTPISIELLLDGFDELDVSDMKSAHELLKTIRTYCKSIRMWVTSRPHLLHELEQNLGIIGFNMQPFSMDDQIRFLTSYWLPQNADIKALEKIKSFSCHLLTALESTMNSKDCDIAGVPLQCLLLAEVYEEDAVSYGNGEQLNSPSVLITSITKLYESLIDRKIQKSGLTNTKALLEMHTRLSLELLFPKQFEKIKHLFCSVEVAEVLKVGLLQASNGSTVPVFVHRTVAEYFIAYFVVNMLSGGAEDFDDVWCSNFIFEDILHAYLTGKNAEYLDDKVADDFDIFDADYYIKYSKIYDDMHYKFTHGVINYFLDSKLSNVDNTTNYIVNFLESCDSSCISNMRKLVWCCATSQCSQILKKFFANNVFEYYIPTLFERLFEVIFEQQLLFHAIAKSSLEIVKFVFLQFAKNHEFDEDTQSKALRVAVTRGEFSIVEFLIKEKKLKRIVEQLNYGTRNLLFLCVENTADNLPSQIDNRIQVMQMLIDINQSLLEIKDNWKRTPIFSRGVHIKLKSELISLGANALKILHKKRYSTPVLYFYVSLYQPIYVQCFNNYFHELVVSIPEKVLRKLVQAKSAISNQTPLHNCLYYFDPLPSTLNAFRKAGANFNCIDKDGYSALATALLYGRSAVTIRKLIECGANVQFRKGWKRKSLLHMAMDFKKVLPESVAVLFKWIDWDVKDLTFKSPMDYAKKYGASTVERFELALALAGKSH